MKTRRQFIRAAGTGIVGRRCYQCIRQLLIQGYYLPKGPISFRLGMAGYTFREFTVDQTIEMMKPGCTSQIFHSKIFTCPITAPLNR